MFPRSPFPTVSVPDPDPRPLPPEEPGPNECCGSGCPLCVLDLYADELQRYRKALAEWQARHPDAAP
nr:oxidoreductase-like domain-containing protein [Stenotrophomonas maltophilia]